MKIIKISRSDGGESTMHILNNTTDIPTEIAKWEQGYRDLNDPDLRLTALSWVEIHN